VEEISILGGGVCNDTTIQIRHQLFLGDVEGDGDLTGLKLWKTVPLPMIQHILQSSSLSLSNTPTTILELGSGCGTLGIGLAALLGPHCNVILTDADVKFVETITAPKRNNKDDDNKQTQPSPQEEWTSLSWLQQNVELNRKDRVSVQPLYWGDEEHMRSILLECQGGVDVIVGSELLYNNDAAFPGLLETLLAFQKHHDDNAPKRPLVIFLGYKVRRLGESKFFDMAREYFDIFETDITQSSGGKSQNQKKKKRGQPDPIRLAELRFKTNKNHEI